MKRHSSPQASVNDLVNKLRPLMRQLEVLRKQARALGLFAGDRELLTCSRCGLMEDESFSGELLTCRESNLGQDTGLRFTRISKGRFRCPSCGQTVHERPPEDHQATGTIPARDKKRSAARIAADRRKLEAHGNHDQATSGQAKPQNHRIRWV